MRASTWMLAPLAALSLAAGDGGREEYSPRTRPVEPDQTCRRGFAPAEVGRSRTEVCVRPCRPRHLLLDDKAKGRLRCVPTRRSRLWYRARLDADVRFDLTHIGSNPAGDHVVTTTANTQRWRFRSDGAALVSRRCTPLSELGPQGARLAFDVPEDAGRIPCKRVARAIETELFEDVSFGFRGRITARGTKNRTQRDITGEVLWRAPAVGTVGAGIRATCARTLVETVTGAGPVWAGALQTLERSARFGGASLAAERRLSLRPTVTTQDAWRCPAPAGAIDPDQHSAPARSTSTELALELLSGLDLANLITPNLASQFGRRRITAERTVRRDRSQAPSTHVTVATFELTLTRCPDAGRDPRPC